MCPRSCQISAACLVFTSPNQWIPLSDLSRCHPVNFPNEGIQNIQLKMKFINEVNEVLKFVHWPCNGNPQVV